jgi:hypothetical protein
VGGEEKGKEGGGRNEAKNTIQEAFSSLSRAGENTSAFSLGFAF